jgi:hypothetical protein
MICLLFKSTKGSDGQEIRLRREITFAHVEKPISAIPLFTLM